MSSESNNKFRLNIVHDNFTAALHEEDDVKLQAYLDSFDELNKFFYLMGTIFGFVSNDLKAKMDILAELLNEPSTTEYFQSVKQMIEYEKTNNLLDKHDYVSGCRTLLRLHRGLDFIREFLKRVAELQNEDNTSTACKEAYELTLAKHHSFIIRSGAKLAMYTLPTREQMLIRVCGDHEEIQIALQMLPKTLEITDVVYKRIETLYTIHNLHTLP